MIRPLRGWTLFFLESGDIIKKIEKPLSIVAILITVLATIMFLVSIIIVTFVFFRNQIVTSETVVSYVLRIVCITLPYLLILGIAQCVQYLKDLVFLKEQSLLKGGYYERV